MQFRERKRSWLSWDISGMEGRVGNSWEYIYNNSCDHHSLVPGGVQVSKVMRTKQIALTGKSSQSPGSWQWQVLAYKVHELRHYVYLHNIFMSKWVEDQIWWFQSSWVPRYDCVPYVLPKFCVHFSVDSLYCTTEDKHQVLKICLLISKFVEGYTFY